MPTEPKPFDPARVDYSGLTTPVSRAEIRQYRSQVRLGAAADPGNPTSSATGIVGLVVVIVGVLLVFGFVFTSSSNSASIVLLAFVILVVVLLGRLLLGVGAWGRILRLSRFAGSNGLLFHVNTSDPGYPGAIFGIGDSRRAYEHLNSASGRFLDLGNYRYSTGSGKNRTTHTWGYVALQLDRQLPNIVLDAKANNRMFGASNLPVAFSRNQVLSLEGDFDRYFTLYCPKEYERDALYVFTPDLMTLMIDEAAAFDVEIVDNWMFVYSASPFDLLSPATLGRLFRIVDTVGAKALSQTDRYADDRAASAGVTGPPAGRMSADIVAPQGRRLRRRTSVFGIVVVVIIVAYWLFTSFGGTHF